MIDLGAILERYGIEVSRDLVPPRTTNVSWDGIMFHHTASSCCRELPSLTTVKYGRPDVTGPLANFMAPRGGGYAKYITHGGANHPGAGDITVLTRLQADQHPAPPGRDVKGASFRARAALIGWECENSGIGEPWFEDTLLLIRRSFAALCMEFGWNPLTRIIGHKEWTRRKIDPFPIDMAAFRYSVVLLVRTPPPITPPKSPEQIEEEALMAAKDEIISGVVAAITPEVERIVAAAYAQELARDAAWEWDTRKLTVPRAARIDGENAQFYVAGTEAGPRRFWIDSLEQLNLLRQMNVVSWMEEYVISDHAEQAAFRSIPIAGPEPASR